MRKPLSVNCLWYATGAADEKKCRRHGCNNRMLTDYPPDKCFANCEAAVGECRHFGAEARRVSCESCGGNVQIKVFACAARSECTLTKFVPDLACCNGCDRFEGAKATGDDRAKP